MDTKCSVIKLVYFLCLSIKKPSARLQMISVFLKTHSDAIYWIL